MQKQAAWRYEGGPAERSLGVLSSACKQVAHRASRSIRRADKGWRLTKPRQVLQNPQEEKPQERAWLLPGPPRERLGLTGQCCSSSHHAEEGQWPLPPLSPRGPCEIGPPEHEAYRVAAPKEHSCKMWYLPFVKSETEPHFSQV